MGKKKRASAYKLSTDDLEEHFVQTAAIWNFGMFSPEDIAPKRFYFFASNASSKSTGNIFENVTPTCNVV